MQAEAPRTEANAPMGLLPEMEDFTKVHFFFFFIVLKNHVGPGPRISDTPAAQLSDIFFALFCIEHDVSGHMLGGT